MCTAETAALSANVCIKDAVMQFILLFLTLLIIHLQGTPKTLELLKYNVDGLSRIPMKLQALTSMCKLICLLM